VYGLVVHLTGGCDGHHKGVGAGREETGDSARQDGEQVEMRACGYQRIKREHSGKQAARQATQRGASEGDQVGHRKSEESAGVTISI